MSTNSKLATLLSSEGYTMAKSLLGSTEHTDNLLCELEWQITLHPEFYPIVALPETRMATVSLPLAGGAVTVAVFFHRFDRDHLELDHLCLKRNTAIDVVPTPNPLALSLAA